MGLYTMIKFKNRLSYVFQLTRYCQGPPAPGVVLRCTLSRMMIFLPVKPGVLIDLIAADSQLVADIAASNRAPVAFWK